MHFSINFVAVLAATVGAAVVSAAWYSFIMAGPVNALRAGDPTIRGRQPGPPLILLSVLANLVAAFVLAVLLESLFGTPGIGDGLLVAALAWLGFSATTMTVIQTFGFRAPGFLWVDGAQWLIVLLVMGAVMGAFG
ncbi:MAG: DUF1761 domain-containing protein [Bauldia sp.]|nr:DUF1761 domain-containing protein [Bauldia sp.]MCW5777813.1 DUF1761 domain-containing protein [Phycisphaeraceae bacterium]